ncbi:translation initiation factor IF-2 [Puccinia graminis f. sp. tritici CRL 75-36-700-3]|uniref:Eukaryotic translation initiation factor 5B n=1 Tax=Puccinia graminis f. sp. tritici (strain CRL 75-36-700-3 / race SCCL) TaxID=418459 RepID=E3KTE2_PUCGT|nr:translation initiation factor IF-2 [Puccinia graminis f. sp. tritici CRL 75-36-700-3]EFP87567.1 translation initiation factor IF-2 [Puccinia graminis f. sp. tritici CRL 75-36-700-3]
MADPIPDEPDMDELYPDPDKGKKAKKNKKKGNKPIADDLDEDELLEQARKAREEAEAKMKTEQPSSPPLNNENDQTPETKGVLSKKEKEKLKKEKEKAKKKAQAASKKATTADSDPKTDAIPPKSDPIKPSVEEVPATPAADNEDGEVENEAQATGTTSKNKKKKKKASEKAEAPKEEPKKKVGGKLSALRAAMEERQRLEAEAKAKAEEEERLRQEEEDRLEAEEKRKEEEKARKKEREKAKKEELRKAGKLLTPKQKAEKAAAELRLKALVESGAVVVGIQERNETAPSSGAKKVTYGNRKKGPKKDPTTDSVKPESKPEPVPDVSKLEIAETPTPPAASSPSPPPPEPPVPEEPDVKDDWEAESDDVKDDWEAGSEEDEKPKPAPAKSTGAKSTKPQEASISSKANKANENKAPPAGKASGKPSQAASKSSKPEARPKDTIVGDSKSKPSGSNATATKNAKAEAAKEAKESEESDEESDSDSDDSDSDSGSGSDSDSDSDDSDSDSDEEGQKMSTARKMAAQKKAEAAARRIKRHEEAMAARKPEDMRSPICCILGHVDTGKTKLLDKIRQTNVQEGEAGGITQQIGATFFPMEAIKRKTAVMAENDLKQYKLPGLLMIDTPGHESFTNLRSRGSSLCNISILVVDIMHGLEQQTLESLKLLRDKKTPFIVALNKIDRLYGWTAIRENAFRDSLSKQVRPVQREFETRLESVILAFAEQGLNAVPYYENTNYSKNVSLVPTSAVTGEGVPDLLMLLIKLTQERMSERLMYLSELECTVLEVKVIEGLGTTIDVVLSNGVLREGDKIVVCGLNGPIVTQVRALLTPQPMKELRIKGQYVHHKEVKASLGIKIVAPELEKAIAGSRLLLLTEDDDEEDLKEEVMGDLTNLMSNIDKSGRGVCVQASTLGSLEALLEFLRTSKIPVSGINIGPVYKRDVMRAGTMLEKAKELAVLLAFDVPIDKDAEKLAEETGVRIFKADIIYHLFDAFTAYNADIMEAKRIDSAPIAVWPCRLKIIQAFTKRDPIIVGCDILEGTLKVGTPLCVVKVDPTTKARTTIPLGKVTSLEINHKSVQTLKREQAGAGVAVKIEHASYQSAMTYGRQFDDKDELISQISRQSIDVLKNVFRAEVSKDEWALIVKLKKELMID